MARSVTAILKTRLKRSVANGAYEQIRDAIVTGERKPGSRLPGERALSEMLGVNRAAVREALKRLEHSRLVSIHQGGATRVLDYRQTARLDVASELLFTPAGQLNPPIAAGVIEMSSAILPDVARLAAMRGGPAATRQLEAIAARMRAAREDPTVVADLALEFLRVLVQASANVAYELIFNTICEIRQQLGPRAGDSRHDPDALERIVHAVSHGDPERAGAAMSVYADRIASADLKDLGELR